MYPIKLEENEAIEVVDEHAKLLEDKEAKEICVIVTGRRLLLLEDGNKKVDSKEVLRIIKAVSYLPSYEILLEVELSFIKEIEDGDYKKYVLENGNYFYLQSDTIYKYLKEMK